MLTDTAIRKLKPSSACKPAKPDKYSDGNGLQLWVRPTGTKTWIVAYRFHGKQNFAFQARQYLLVAYRFHGKQTNITLGTYPAISLQQARLQALAIKEQLTRH